MAVTNEKGRNYCKQHTPSIREAKGDERSRKWNAEWDAKRDAEKRAADELSALRALRDAVGKYLVDPDAWDHLLKECYEKAKAFDAK